jgi:hypothetical protein
VLASDQRGGLWHVRVDRHPGEAVQVAEGIGPIRPVAGVDRKGRLVAAFTDQEGELRLVRIGRDGRVEHREGLGRDFAIPLAIVADRAEMLVVAMDAEQRVAARGSELGWESLHSLERLLEGPIARVKLEPIET